MDIKISDEILKKSNLSDKDIKIEIAILFYKKGLLSLGQASEIADMHKIQFQKELANRQVPQNYDLTSLKEDIMTLKDFKKL